MDVKFAVPLECADLGSASIDIILDSAVHMALNSCLAAVTSAVCRVCIVSSTLVGQALK
jgi:hypothetical protein